VAVAAAMTFGIVSVASAVPASHRLAPGSHAVKKVKFTGQYSGKIHFLINGKTLTAMSATGTGTATLLNKSTLSGAGSSTVSSSCDPMAGHGALTGSGSKLSLVVVQSTSQGCTQAQQSPYPVTVSGTAKVTSGTGKYKGATGDLSFTGHFTLPSSTTGSTDSFTAKLTGTLSIKN